jgi:hypothetical protein
MKIDLKTLSKNDLLVGVLVLIAGIIYYLFTYYSFNVNSSAPGAGRLLMTPAAHTTGHYIASVVAIIFGVVGLVMYKKINKVTFAVSALSVILGLVILLDAPTWPLYSVLNPHPQAMASVAGLIMLVGVVGIVGSAVLKPKK